MMTMTATNGQRLQPADGNRVEMTQIALSWLLTKVELPIVRTAKLHHIEGAMKALDIHLSEGDIRYLKEPYLTHNLSGVMAVNKPVISEDPVGSSQKETSNTE